MTASAPKTRRPTRLAKVAPDLPSHLAWIADESRLVQEGPLELSITPGDPRMCILVGDNAAGKSLVFRMLAMRVADEKGLAVVSSIRERAQEGIPRAFMYGEEREQSTGATTLQWIFAAVERNLDREGGCFLGLDEPELGLSEGYARALGQYIGNEYRYLPGKCGGVVAVTHSRPFVRGLLEAMGPKKAPTFAVMASEPMSVHEWLDREDVRTVDELRALERLGLDRWREINQLLRG